MGLELASFDVLLLFAAAITATAFFLLRQRLSKRIFYLWRMATLLLLLILLCQPAVVKYSSAARPLLAVVTDVSPSMSWSGRSIAVARFLEEHRRELEDGYAVRYFGFAERTGEVKKPSGLSKADFGQGTDIRNSLWQVKRDCGALDGILLISDGNHNAEPLSPGWGKELGVPVFPVALESERRIKDAAVQSVKVSDFAFKSTPVELTAMVRIRGYRYGKVTVRLVDEKANALAARAIDIAGDDELREVPLRFTPEKTGDFRYTVEVSPLPAELTLANNRQAFALDVVRDKLRVLFLCGQPGPEYAFLRHYLKNDPLCELVSFVILRNPENIALVPENDLALIPFPVNTLFTRDLLNFDVMILENFTYQRFGFLPEYLDNIRQWVVERGGGLIMTGGPRSFGSGGWAGTPVEEILPVTLEKPGEQYEEGAFRPVVEKDSHFLMTVNEDRDKNETIWRNIAGLDGYQPLHARPGAEVLLRHPFSNAAVLSAWEKGKGRVVALASNTTWRWALQSSEPGMYARFWGNIVRYLGQSSESRKLQVLFDQSFYSASQKFTVKIRTIERVTGHRLELECVDPAGKKEIIPLARRGDREWAGHGVFPGPGNYRFRAVLSLNGKAVARRALTKKVDPSLAGEETALDTNAALLEEIAKASQGRYFTENAFSTEEIAPLLKNEERRKGKEKLPLWSSSWWLAVIVASLALEWYFRRKAGLL